MAEISRSLPTGEIALVGDLMLARKVSAALRAGRPPEAFWGDVRPRLQAADAVIGNLECALTLHGKPHVVKAFHFLADPGAGEILKAGNVACVALANNHVLDGGARGLTETLATLDRLGIAHAGAGENRDAALAPTMFRAGALTVGFASITNTLWAFRALADRAGTAFVRIREDQATIGLLKSLADGMNERGAEVRVLSIHWGPNFRPRPPAHYRAFARQAILAGFDIVHGHSAHILQAVEAFGSGLILYDTGDFLDDYWIMPGFRMDRSFLFLVTVGKGSRPQLKLVPVTLAPGTVNYAVGGEAETIRRAMVRRCRGYAIDFARDGNALLAVPKPAHDTAIGPAARSIASASRTA